MQYGLVLTGEGTEFTFNIPNWRLAANTTYALVAGSTNANPVKWSNIQLGGPIVGVDWPAQAQNGFTFSSNLAFYTDPISPNPFWKTTTNTNEAIEMRVAFINPSPITFSLGGVITGLRTATDVTLLNNGGSPLTTQNGSFTFPEGIPQGSSYSVTVGSQPPGQTCSVANGAGVANGNVTNLEVRCIDNRYRIGGTLTGLAAGERVRLLNNGVELLEVSANGAFNFSQTAGWNGHYNSVILSQPSTQTCILIGGSGSYVRNNITSILVNCGPNALVEGQTLSKSELLFAACGGSTLYKNLQYATVPGSENSSRIAACDKASIRLTYDDFLNDAVSKKHELMGGIEVQGYSGDYRATSYFGMVSLVHKSTGQTIGFQLTRPLPGSNNAGINVDFLDGSIGFTAHRTFPQLVWPNGQWTIWITRGGSGTEGWGTVPALQLLPERSVDLKDVGEALNHQQNAEDVNWIDAP